MQTVSDIGIGCAGIEVEEKQRQMRVEIFVTTLYSFADDMVRNTAERLQRDHFVDAMIRQVAYLTGQEPSLAEVRSGICRGLHVEVKPLKSPQFRRTEKSLTEQRR